MKQLRCLCLLLAASLFLSCVSSNVYAADSVDMSNARLTVNYYMSGYFKYTHYATYDPTLNYFVKQEDKNDYFKISDVYKDSVSSVQLNYTLERDGVLCEKDKQCTVEINGIVPVYGANPVSSDVNNYKFARALNPSVRIYYTDGSYKDIKLDSNSYTYNSSTFGVGIKFTFVAEKAVSKVMYYCAFPMSCLQNNSGYSTASTFNNSYYLYVKLHRATCNVTTVSEEKEMLTGILGWLQNVYNNISSVGSGIGNLPSNLWNKMNGSFNSLIGSTGDILTSVGSVVTYLNKLPSDMWNKMSSSFGDLIAGNESLLSSTGDILGYTSSLPTNIWNKMSGSFGNLISSAGNIYNTLQDMPGLVWGEMKETFTSIKTNTQSLVSDVKQIPTLIVSGVQGGMSALWVPTDDKINSFKDDCTSLIKSRFGAAYECVDYVMDFVDTFKSKEAIDVIHFPSITLDFAGTDFVFGGYDVDLIHKDMEGNVEYLKWGISLVSTFATVNSLKNRFVNEFLGA